MTADFAKLFDDLKKEIKQEFKDFRSAFEREIRKELREIKLSLDNFNKDFEDMRADVAMLKKENASLKTNNGDLREECKALKSQAEQSERRLTACEQYSRNRNIEIKGVPSVQNEDLAAILQTIGNLIDEPILPCDIDVCHRVPAGNSSSCPLIIAQFKYRSKRDAVIEKARRKRVSTADLGHATRAPVYVNEHLCPELKKLLGMTIAKKNELKWKFAWTRGGKIYARKTDESRVVHISSTSDLAKMM